MREFLTIEAVDRTSRGVVLGGTDLRVSRASKASLLALKGSTVILRHANGAEAVRVSLDDVDLSVGISGGRNIYLLVALNDDVAQSCIGGSVELADARAWARLAA